jgi:hypothetical protein
MCIYICVCVYVYICVCVYIYIIYIYLLPLFLSFSLSVVLRASTIDGILQVRKLRLRGDVIGPKLSSQSGSELELHPGFLSFFCIAMLHLLQSRNTWRIGMVLGEGV